MGMGRAAERTEDVGSAMIQSAADCCKYRETAGAIAAQSNIVSFILALIVLGALVGLAAMFAGACIDGIRSKLLAR